MKTLLIALCALLLPSCYNTQTRQEFAAAVRSISTQHPGHIGYRGSDEHYDYFDLRNPSLNISRIRIPQENYALENGERRPIGTFGTGNKTMYPTIACSNNPALRNEYRITEETPIVSSSKSLDDVQYLTPGKPIFIQAEN